MKIDTLEHFFFKELKKGASLYNIHLEQSIEYYIVQLLTHYSKKTFSDEPLALIFKKALDSNKTKRKQCLRQIGDRALYFSGFFKDYFNRKTYGVDYYVSMGKLAYNNLSILSSAQKNTFQKLSLNFEFLVNILQEISLNENLTDFDLLKIYKDWIQTDSKRLETILKNHNFFPESEEEVKIY